MTTRIRRAACAATCTLLALPSAAGARPRPVGLRTVPRAVSSRPRAPRPGPREGTSALVKRLHLSVRHAATTTGHFNYPLGLATNAAGDVFVANYGGNDIREISPTYAVSTTFKITQDLSGPISVATDPAGDVYAGNINGGVEEYSASGSPSQQFTANAGDPSSIAVDQYGDLYLADSNNLAIDDPYGNSLYSSVNTGGATTSVALGGAYVWSLQEGGTAAFGNGSVTLRQGTLQQSEPGLPFGDPVGAACSASNACWVIDESKTLTEFIYSPAGDSFTLIGPINLPYVPAGIAYDSLHHLLYISDPVGNLIDVYNAKTFALVKTIT